MRRLVALLVVLALALATLWTVRRARTRAPGEMRARVEESRPAAVLADAGRGVEAEPPGGPTRDAIEAGAAEPQPERTLRVRVVDAERGTTVRDCGVHLEYAGKQAGTGTELADGSHEFRGAVRAGTEVVVRNCWGFELDPERVEIDEIPEHELVFPARALPMGTVHGTLVDDVEGRPLPYQRFSADFEELVTDARGAFRGVELHPRGTLAFWAGGWTYELGGWSPERDEPVVVPARVGPTLFVELDRTPLQGWGRWSSDAFDSATAIGLNPHLGEGEFSVGARLELEPLPRVQFDWEENRPLDRGTLFVGSHPDFLFGKAELAADLGSPEAPLRIELGPCGLLVVVPEFSRELASEERDRVSFVLVDGEGREAVTTVRQGQCGFIVLEAGERRVEARFDGLELARSSVTTKLQEAVLVRLLVPLPRGDPRADEARVVPPYESRFPFTARVTSARNRHYPAALRFTRVSDGEETLAEVEWTKEDGRWIGRAEDKLPSGAHQAQLELRPAYDWSGPRRLEETPAGELRFEIDDTPPLVDVYFAPVAAEDGRPLPAYDADVLIEGGDTIAGDTFLSPSVPVVSGHPRSVPFDWTCVAPGRRMTCGSTVPDGGEGDIVVPVVLERGRGLRLYVGDAGGNGLAGVRVFADGVPVGLTSRSGILCLAEGPERLTFAYEDWGDDGRGDVEADGTFDAGEWINVFLAPPR